MNLHLTPIRISVVFIDGLLGRGTRELPVILENPLRRAVPRRPLFRHQATRVLPPLLRGGLRRAHAVRLLGKPASLYLRIKVNCPFNILFKFKILMQGTVRT